MPTFELTDHNKKFLVDTVVAEILRDDVEFSTVVEILEDYNISEDDLSIIHDGVFDELDYIYRLWVNDDD